MRFLVVIFYTHIMAIFNVSRQYNQTHCLVTTFNMYNNYRFNNIDYNTFNN